jgi:chromate reductase
MQTNEAARPILAICGSIRRGSYNRRLLEAAARHAPSRLSIRLHDSLEMLPMFSEDLEQATQGGPEPVERMRKAVAAADGILIATPEYNWSIPGVLKNAIDWLSRTEATLSGKPVAVIGASTGRWGTRQSQAVLRHTLTATESVVMPAPALFVRDAEQMFDASGALTDPATLRGLAAVLDRFATWVDLHAGAGTNAL